MVAIGGAFSKLRMDIGGCVGDLVRFWGLIWYTAWVGQLVLLMCCGLPGRRTERDVREVMAMMGRSMLGEIGALGNSYAYRRGT